MNHTDFAWLSISTILVLAMVVLGIGLFYGGMVRSKNVLSVLMQTLSVFSLGIVLWFVYGYSLAFTEGNAFFGGFTRLFLSGLFDSSSQEFVMSGSIPEISFAAFQATFAGLTCALVIGGFAERIKFSVVMLFTVIWFTFCYIPVAHMVWYGSDNVSGLLFSAGDLDFAGGTVVHINAGVAALVGAYMVGRRVGYGSTSMRPHNLPMTFIGAMLLWVGWFGFNAGSALAADENAALAMFNTLIATAGGVVAWVVAEGAIKGKPSLLGAASGTVAGLVGITPGAAFVGPFGALVIGVLTSLVCLWGVNGLKKILKVDDTLDVFGVHGVGGIIGALLTGIFNARFFGGPGLDSVGKIPAQFWIQFEGVLITVIWSSVVAWIAYRISGALLGGLRVSDEEERDGLDMSSHGESAYHG